MKLGHTQFETEMLVRPDDIDMHQHVHSSRYIDYVTAARYEQMERCYKMPLHEFTRLRLGWFIRGAQLDFKRPLRLGEAFKVKTWVLEINHTDVRVGFEIRKKENTKLCCDGNFLYTMVRLENGRAAPIPDWIVEKYSV